jgi:hypothetical protein
MSEVIIVKEVENNVTISEEVIEISVATTGPQGPMGQAVWDNIAGDQSDVELSGFTDDLGVVTHISSENNPHNVTKAQVGLSDVDNVQQATKTEFDNHTSNNTIHFSDAPGDSKQYVRFNNTWQEVDIEDLDWDNLTGDQSVINISGFTNDSAFITASSTDMLTNKSGSNSMWTNDEGYITTYTVTESDVTQHEAALSITESQITDLGTYATVSQLNNKQDTLVSGTNIKTINTESIVGSGNINITGGGGDVPIMPNSDCLFMYDDFNRADGALDATNAPTGQTYESSSSDIAIVNKKIMTPNNNTTRTLLWDQASPAGVWTYLPTRQQRNSGGATFVVIAYQNATNYMYGEWNGAQLRIIAVVADTPSTLVAVNPVQANARSHLLALTPTTMAVSRSSGSTTWNISFHAPIHDATVQLTNDTTANTLLNASVKNGFIFSGRETGLEYFMIYRPENE